MKKSFIESFLRNLIPRNEVAWLIAKRRLYDSQIEALHSISDSHTEKLINQD